MYELRIVEQAPNNSPRCADCDGTGWVCETHVLRPWEGPNACGCGAAAAPCGRCNNEADSWPRLPQGFKADPEKDGRYC
jgi:hypothetical protein